MNYREIALRRLAASRLTHEPFARPEDAVRWLGAVQAQDYAGAKWALGLRSQNTTNSAIDQALNDERILRTHLLRPTWHFALPEDLRAFPIPEIAAPVAHLLPNYDEYFIGFKARAAILDRVSTLQEAATRDALGSHLIVIDGQVAGGWKRTITSRLVIVHLRPLIALTDDHHRAAGVAAQRYGVFLELPVVA